MGNGINEQISALMSLKQRGMQPQQVMQMMLQQNPQLQQQLQTLQNMAQGQDPKTFIMQLARQNGANQQSINSIMQLLGK
jgi:DNA-binding transcriptional MerR regulator